MRSIKKTIKIALGYLHSMLSGVKYSKGVYIGVGAKIVGGKNVSIGERAEIMPYSMMVSLGGKIEVGKGTTISMFSRIGAIGYVKIGDYVAMGPNCFIADYNHKYENVDVPIIRQGVRFSARVDGSPNVEIGDGSWLGTHVVIAGNIKIGKHCVVGANSVVTKDIPDYCVAVGAPAKVVKRYNFAIREWEKVLN